MCRCVTVPGPIIFTSGKDKFMAQLKGGSKMKKTSFVLTGFLAMLILFISAGASFASCTLGVTDCRPSAPGRKTCYKWACETCGSETCWIFKGTTCTCPSSKNESDQSMSVCQYQPGSQSLDENLTGRSEGK